MNRYQFEHKAERLGFDLENGCTQDATHLLRNEIYSDPRAAYDLIQRARQLDGPHPVDDVIIESDGDVIVHNNLNGFEQYAGTLPGFSRPLPVPPPTTPIEHTCLTPVAKQDDNGLAAAAIIGGAALVLGGIIIGSQQHERR